MKPSRRSKGKSEAKKYLKPGALAQLRDAKRSTRSSCLAAVHETRTRGLNNLTDADPQEVEMMPCFSNRTFGPAFTQRKKLVAQKDFLLVPASQQEITVSALHTEEITGNRMLTQEIRATPMPTQAEDHNTLSDLPLLDTLPSDILTVH
ncbi:hypothetical protein SUGI_0334620 [Cryptomeria japonica]|uniref:uncharacterized protein LOC131076176 n=1 Tax=Cryptomeria japonica TaxID=3369 RepID=UPI002408B307|nr:uncharacterized protein LOC131076176 [Cryptomeria japonica]GLJ18746.1 hypothetical protein SUGI_0334620 [Cryptomeria japonica]